MLLLLALACGIGEPSAAAAAVDADGDGYVEGEDCDDNDATISPEAADDSCDGLDQDCDGHPDDEAPEGGLWYADHDGDGYGDFGAPLVACSPPTGFTQDFRDCDDADATVHPLASERTCDGVDSDCDGDFDEDAPEATEFYADADGDGYGDASSAVMGCEAPEGAVSDATDCDDSAAAARPGGEEVCGDEVDGDCDGVVDEACGGPIVADLGRSPRLVGEAPDQVLFSWGAEIGMALAMGGDSDGDGIGELLIGLPHAYPNDWYSGRVYVIEDVPEGESTFAAAGRVIDGVEPDSRAGNAVAFLADADGDGADEILVGAPWLGDRGAVFVVGGGGGSGTFAGARAVLLGEEEGAEAGRGVADGGNFLSEGTILVGSPDTDEGGLVYVVPANTVGELTLGSAAAALLRGEPARPCAGEDIAKAGDLNGDGVDDLVIGGSGACEYEIYEGAAWVVLGPASGDLSLSDADARLSGVGEEDGAGTAVAGPGDMDGDGHDDVAIGAPFATSSAGGLGIVYVFLGNSPGDLSLDAAPIRLDAAHSDTYAGGSLSSLGDIDGDGFADLLVGVPYQENANGYCGGAYIVAGVQLGAWDLRSTASLLLGTEGDAATGAAVAGGAFGPDGSLSIAAGAIGPTSYVEADEYLGAVGLASGSEWY